MVLYRTRLIKDVLLPLTQALGRISGDVNTQHINGLEALDTELLAALLRTPEDIRAFCSDLTIELAYLGFQLHAEYVDNPAARRMVGIKGEGFVVRPNDDPEGLGFNALNELEQAARYYRIDAGGVGFAGNMSLTILQKHEARLAAEAQLEAMVWASLDARGRLLHGIVRELKARAKGNPDALAFLAIVRDATDMDQWLHSGTVADPHMGTPEWERGRQEVLDKAQGQLAAICGLLNLAFSELCAAAEANLAPEKTS